MLQKEAKARPLRPEAQLHPTTCALRGSQEVAKSQADGQTEGNMKTTVSHHLSSKSPSTNSPSLQPQQYQLVFPSHHLSPTSQRLPHPPRLPQPPRRPRHCLPGPVPCPSITHRPIHQTHRLPTPPLLSTPPQTLRICMSAARPPAASP